MLIHFGITSMDVEFQIIELIIGKSVTAPMNKATLQIGWYVKDIQRKSS